MSNRRIRLALFGGSLIILVIVFLFLWIVNVNQIGAEKETFEVYLLALGGLSVVMLAAFFAFSQVFDENGRIYSSRITTMLVTLLMIVQLALVFSTYTNRTMDVSFDSFEDAYGIVSRLDAADENEYGEIIKNSYKDEYDYIAIVDGDSKVKLSSDANMIGRVIVTKGDMSFVLYSGDRLVVRTSSDYRGGEISELLLSQITLLIVSLLFSVEFVMFVIGRVGLMQKDKSTYDKKLPTVLINIRQIAFLFYFASRLSASFIPVMAKKLPSGSLALSANMVAALPQTAETFMTCIAILFTSRILTKKGWKPPFAIGLSLVVAGIAVSAFAPTLVTFTLARALVGLGYGFCWMTLRSVSLFATDDASRIYGFSMLNAGLFAGMFCGSTVGSILASSFGYGTVLIISSALVALCAIYILTMENKRLLVPAADDAQNGCSRQAIGWRNILNLVAYLLLMIAPSCIVVAYSDYFLPLYYEQIGRTTLDVGRSQLIYGLLIVYIGPLVTSLLVKRKLSLILTNVLYNVLLALGLILLGVWGGFAASVVTISIIALGDSFGFGVQNNYFLSLAISKRLGSSRSLTYLSLGKKLMEMLGPSIFALSMTQSSTQGVLRMGMIFLIAAVAFIAIRALSSYKSAKGME